MKPDSMLVEPEMIAEAYRAVLEAEDGKAFEELKQREPVLGSWAKQEMLCVVGKMGLSGAPHEVLVGAFNDFTSILLTALEAVRSGHYALWKDSFSETSFESPLNEEMEGESIEATGNFEASDFRDEGDLTE